MLVYGYTLQTELFLNGCITQILIVRVVCVNIKIDLSPTYTTCKHGERHNPQLQAWGDFACYSFIGLQVAALYYI